MPREVKIGDDAKEAPQYYQALAADAHRLTVRQGILLPAVLCRPKAVRGLCHQQFTVETGDREDHLFSGIMFDIRCSPRFPIQNIEVSALWVRGRLGPELTVWYRPGGHGERGGAGWACLHRAAHLPSYDELVRVPLDEPILLKPGEVAGLYVHSNSESDDGIVYDNQHGQTTSDDGVIQLLPGLAHISSQPFGRNGYWGGSAWRQNRQFVGRVEYGTRWLRWNPEVNDNFPPSFQLVARHLFAGLNQPGCVFGRLSEECMMFIINKVPWNAFGEQMEPEQPAAAQPPSQHEHPGLGSWAYDYAGSSDDYGHAFAWDDDSSDEEGQNPAQDETDSDTTDDEPDWP